MKIKKEVIWIVTWLFLSTFTAFMIFSICVDRPSRIGLGILGFLMLLCLYGLAVMNDYKLGIMPINRDTFFYFETVFYMLMNILVLAYIPHIYVSIYIAALIIVPKFIHGYFDE